MQLDSIQSYDDALAFLAARIDYEQAAAEKMTVRSFKLDRMRELLASVGDPQETIPAVHIAGTKGKGSTAAMTAEMLTAAGYRVGLFTSPHMAAFEERMRVGGEMPDAETVTRLVNRIASVVGPMDLDGPAMQATYFEIATAMAWLYFRQMCCDFVVLEVGMGGRLDSTNLCRPDVTVITNISRDHMQILGDSERLIAREKAGIIKPHVPVISGVLHPEAAAEIEAVAARNEADLYRLSHDLQFEYERAGDNRTSKIDVQAPHSDFHGLPLVLTGEHQAANAALAVSAIDVLRNRGYHIPDVAVEQGMANVRLPLRFERVAGNPEFIVDAAHNAASAQAFAKTLRIEYADRRRSLIFATSRDKEVERIAELLFPEFDRVILTRFLGNPRAIPPDELLERTRAFCPADVTTADDPAAAIELVRRKADPGEVVCATGSFYLAAEVRGLLMNSAVGQPVQLERIEN